ncbi:unnamed protein product, partial [Discosporangium mesarthrocarpum]
VTVNSSIPRRLLVGPEGELFLAGCLGSFVDLDHFVAAGSLRLSQALGLAARPWGHSILALFLGVSDFPPLSSYPPMLSLFRGRLFGHEEYVVFSGASHQLRDATRRGLWMWPPHGPSTAPLPYPVYLLAQAVLPVAVAA